MVVDGCHNECVILSISISCLPCFLYKRLYELFQLIFLFQATAYLIQSFSKFILSLSVFVSFAIFHQIEASWRGFYFLAFQAKLILSAGSESLCFRSRNGNCSIGRIDLEEMSSSSFQSCNIDRMGRGGCCIRDAGGAPHGSAPGHIDTASGWD